MTVDGKVIYDTFCIGLEAFFFFADIPIKMFVREFI